jgi:hypothetical protein
MSRFPLTVSVAYISRLALAQVKVPARSKLDLVKLQCSEEIGPKSVQNRSGFSVCGVYWSKRDTKFTKTLLKLYRVLPSFHFSPPMTRMSSSRDGTTVRRGLGALPPE